MNQDELVNLYHQMLLIRRFEEKAAEMYALGKIGGFLHLYVGEEAVAVGAVSAMSSEDHLVTHYRDHGYAIAKGCEPKKAMAELFGKATGLSKGKGGSMHMADVSRHFWGGYAIVGGHLPLATGIALACQYQENRQVVLCVMGEGATNIVRHSRGSQCSISIERTGGEVRLEVLDDGPRPGPGARARATVGTGRGLRGVAERLAQAGGTMTSGWREGDSFALVVTVPARPQSSSPAGAAASQDRSAAGEQDRQSGSMS